MLLKGMQLSAENCEIQTTKNVFGTLISANRIPSIV